MNQLLLHAISLSDSIQTLSLIHILSGYHNLAKQAFIKQIAGDNPGKQWHHFGDIDPDGFYIVENLIRGTGIDFHMVYMDTDLSLIHI